MLDSIILKDNIIQYKNDNLNDSLYTGFDIYEELIPEYIFNNIQIQGIYINSVGVVVTNVSAIPTIFLPLQLSQYYQDLESFVVDFESKILQSMTFTTPVGIITLIPIIPLLLSTALVQQMKTMPDYTYETIVTEFSDIILNWIKTNTILTITNVLGSYTSITII